MGSILRASCAVGLIGVAYAPSAAAEPLRIPLAAGWAIQSSARVAAAGEAISQSGFSTGGWHVATVPATVVGALVEDGTFADPYAGTNLRTLPGTAYPIGGQFALLPRPADSPYAVAWWYRKTFDLPPAAAGERVSLHFDGI